MRSIDVSSVATGSKKFAGICEAGGKLYAAPSCSSSMMEYDPKTGALRSIDVSSVATGDGKFAGICEAGGKLYAAPFNSKNMMEYDPKTGAVRSIDVSSVVTGNCKFAGICEAGGKLYAAPHGSLSMMEYDPKTGALRSIDVSSVTTMPCSFAGICEAGGKLYAAPFVSHSMMEYDPKTGALRSIDVSSVQAYFKFAGICEAGGKLYAAPSNSKSMMEYDPKTGAVRSIDVSSVITGNCKFAGICEAGGKLYAAPRNSSSMMEYDPKTGALRSIDVSSVATGDGKFDGICEAGGKLYAAPCSSSSMMEYDRAEEKEPQGSALAAARSSRRCQGDEGLAEKVAEIQAVLEEFGAEAVLESAQACRAFLVKHGIGKERKYVSRMIILGASEDATLGIEELCGIDDDMKMHHLQHGMLALKEEIRLAGAQKDIDNMNYILDGIAQDVKYIPAHVKEFIAKGQYHGGALGKDDFDRNNAGKTFEDFCNHPHAKLAKLKPVHVFCLRFYTTDSFPLFNGPLRAKQKPHPLAMTVFYLTEGIKKLRSVEAKLVEESFTKDLMLYRGMKDMTLDEEKFAKVGGTELAVMSTSENMEIAKKYAESSRGLIFEYETDGMTRGVSLEAFSVYPFEKERAYPPGTFIKPKGQRTEGNIAICTVLPRMP